MKPWFHERVFIKIVDDLGIYYKIGLTTDFTGKLFNEMYSWLGFLIAMFTELIINQETSPFFRALMLSNGNWQRTNLPLTNIYLWLCALTK